MENITVSVDGDVARRAKVRAAKQKTSVSVILCGMFVKLAEDKGEFEPLRELEKRKVQSLRRPQFSAIPIAWTWKGCIP